MFVVDPDEKVDGNYSAKSSLSRGFDEIRDANAFKEAAAFRVPAEWSMRELRAICCKIGDRLLWRMRTKRKNGLCKSEKGMVDLMRGEEFG